MFAKIGENALKDARPALFYLTKRRYCTRLMPHESRMMIASLMMYARPELKGAHDRYWSAIRSALSARGIEAPVVLANDSDPTSVWTDPDLVISQTCGMPYRKFLKDKVSLIGTPDFGLHGCKAGYYNSAIVVRANDPRTRLLAFKDATFAFNETVSQSGYAAPFVHAAAEGFWFSRRIQSGGHLASAKCVADGTADIAAIDAMTWVFIERYDSFAADLRVLEWTEPTPGLPYVTAQHTKTVAMFDAVTEAIEVLSAQDRADLSLKGLVKIPKDAYLAVETDL